MKDFNEFLKTIDGYTLEVLCDNANHKISTLPPDADVGTKMGYASFSIAIELLEFYHKWISEED